MDEIINIGSRREVFWDDTMLNTERTRTETRMHEPIKRECVVRFDDDWGGDGCNYISVIQDGDTYRMYVNVHRTPEHPDRENWKESVELYMESKDGIHWEKPNLGICNFKGSTENNIMFTYLPDDPLTRVGDGFRVMIDPRPDCPPDEKYKAVGDMESKLFLFTSPDGKYFTRRHALDLDGQFDSVNSLIYDENTKTYRCFYRTYHPGHTPMNGGWIRQISHSESTGLKNWTKEQVLRYNTLVDWQLYTNAISPYFRANHIYVGFPARYIERPIEWTDNYEELKGKEMRHHRFETYGERRCGISTSDCLFMTSHDGINWTRYNNAFLKPGLENGRNWNYGDCYISAGMVETKSLYEGEPNEISFYVGENRWMGTPGEIYRYTMRLDGFVSQYVGWDSTWGSPALVTKKFIFDGDELYINFSTSAFGHMQIKLMADDGTWLETNEIFGDDVDRHVRFKNGSPKDLKGKPVVMEIKMRDAEIYSFKFE